MCDLTVRDDSRWLKANAHVVKVQTGFAWSQAEPAEPGEVLLHTSVSTCSCSVQVNVQQHAFCGAVSAGQSLSGCSVITHRLCCFQKFNRSCARQMASANESVSASVSFMQPVQVTDTAVQSICNVYPSA